MHTNSTLAELATTHPAASRVFQRFGLDYCCGGKKPLAEVCRTKGLDPDAVIGAIADEETRVDLPRWDNAPFDELIKFVVERYHESLRTELPALLALAARVDSRHAEKDACPRGLHDHLEHMHQSVLEHLEKEERILFPMILAGHGARATGPVHVMEAEHDDHGESLRRVRELTNDLTPPAEACPTWRALYLRLADLEHDLMDHIHLENNVLFPRALRS
jgi:regulator of cell morphogenesis and NO signaling